MVEFKSTKPELSLTYDGVGKVTFSAPTVKLKALSALKENKDYVVEIKEYRQKRSLNANAFFWVLVGQIADKLQTSPEEVYLSLLSDYGTYTFLIVKPNLVDRVKAEWRTVEELGEVNVNGSKGVQLKCYFGSSTYNTKEMSRLIEGTVYEAKELDIDTRTPEEIALMCEEWKPCKA